VLEERRVFVCRFVPAREDRARTTRLLEACDADHALRDFEEQLSSSDTAGWIDVLDARGVLLRTVFHAK
jgi:hypothetical protein